MKTFVLLCIFHSLMLGANAGKMKQTNLAIDPQDAEELAKNDVVGKPISTEEYTASQPLDEDKDLTHLDTIINAGQFEGDIVKQNRKRNAIVDNNKKWPNAIIPYLISSAFSSQERSVIANAIRTYETKTCIRFKARTTEADYIHILNGGSGQCYSMVGRQGGRQVVSIGTGCAYTVTVLHELMHAAGFWHEQSRTDRDQYVRINFQNIRSGLEYNFNSYSSNQINDLKATYDYCSIMHYGATAFSKNGQPTITVLKSSNCVIGRANDFSEVDIKKLNTLYQCTGYPQVGGSTTASTSTAATATTTPSSNCVDKDQRCPGWAARYCNDSRYMQYMTKNCPKSCKLCNGEITTGTTTPRTTPATSAPTTTATTSKATTATTTPSSSCVDKNQGCPGWAARYCNDTQYKQWMSINCPKSCKVCNTTGTCQTDKSSSCQRWADLGYCTGRYEDYMKRFCDTTCNC